ncbi:hypothetical protein CA267_010870 [Alteromonas pelagimontana]|uniref:Uncharacterized protein n=1 Tax=Alteromonas pelagimontana TaxID=1858656 RepID=A0A6M4MDZ7_9ALTE|nr:hypothetical protein [Alteromonas pelagimontana]QJR81247.1 hypothetical protein CA267_010870 [Alteromonas pelagimontana]
MKYLIFSLLLIAFNSYSLTLGMTLRTQFKYSDYVGVVEILEIDSSQSCGQLVTAKPLKTFKGKDEIFQFWVLNEKDLLLIDSEKYLAFLSERQQEIHCDNAVLSTSLGFQTFFPFRSYDGKMYVLAYRESFMSSNDTISYYSVGFVEMLQVIDQRIFALGKWSELEEALLEE